MGRDTNAQPPRAAAREREFTLPKVVEVRPSDRRMTPRQRVALSLLLKPEPPDPR